MQCVALAGFAGLMLAAAFEDLRRLIIPNALTLAVCLLWPLYITAAPNLFDVLGALCCALIVFLVGALGFSRGYLGGGDVKLLAAATLWAGPGGIVVLLLLTGVLGGLLAIFVMMPLGSYLISVFRRKLGSAEAPSMGGLSAPVPYGIAIAGAAVITVFTPYVR